MNCKVSNSFFSGAKGFLYQHCRGRRTESTGILGLIVLIDVITLLLSVLSLIRSHGAILDYYVFLGGQDRFMDFFNHIGYTADLKRTYYADVNANAPAFAYLFYSVLYHILPEGSVTNFNSQATSSCALLIFLIYNIVLCSAIVYNAIFLLKPCFKQGFVLCICFFTSFIFLHAVERGNSVIIVLWLLLASFRLRDNDSKLTREMALICIAVAAGFKVYPAAIWILYILEKRYKEAVRLIIYISVILILPFAFLGGFHGIFQFLANQQELHQKVTSSEASIIAVLRLMMPNSEPGKIELLTIVFSVGLIICCIVSLLVLKETWKRAALLIAIMTMIPQWSGIYTLIYFFIPLVLFVALKAEDTETLKPYDIYYGLLFSLIISLLLTGKTWHELPVGKLIPLFSAYLLVISLMIEGLYRLLKSRRVF